MTRHIRHNDTLRIACLSAFAVGVAGLLGLASSHLVPVMVGTASCLPIFSYLRHTGWGRAVTEPTPATIIIGFYILVIPARALVIAASGYTDVLQLPGAISSKDMVPVLLLLSMGTTTLLETYFFAASRSGRAERQARSSWSFEPLAPGLERFAVLLAGLALAGLGGVLVQYGGLSAAQAALATHAIAAALQGNTTSSGSLWSIFAVPAVWATACVAVNRATNTGTRLAFAATALVIVMAELIVYGSRLNALLALFGVWVMFHHSGRRVPLRAILLGLVVLVLISGPITSARYETPQAGVPTLERYSRLAGYGVLDATLAVWHEPSQVRSQLLSAQRWLDLPAYLVPSFLWRGRPNINQQRLGLFVADTIGTVNDKATGFPTTYMTEGWLIFGWPGVLLLSILFGTAIGWADRKLLGPLSDPRLAGVALLTYSFVVAGAFGYYKDGDLVATFVGEVRTAAYLACLMLLSGAWGWRTRRSDPVAAESVHGEPSAYIHTVKL